MFTAMRFGMSNAEQEKMKLVPSGGENERTSAVHSEERNGDGGEMEGRACSACAVSDNPFCSGEWKRQQFTMHRGVCEE